MRRVAVIVDADIKPFTASLAQGTAQAIAFRQILDGIDDRIDVDIRVDRSGIAGAATESRALRSEIDTLSGRLGVGLDLLAMFGPAAAPIAALAVPAMAGLATQATLAGAAGLTAVLAFQGMGDALSAIEKARLEPTVENLQAAQAALDQLTPAAAEFAEKLADMRGRISSATVDAAGEGMFPGLTRSLDDIDGALPRAERFFRTMGDITGDLVADNVESLTSGRWTEFVDYLESEGRPTLTALNEAVGDLVHGLGELIMAGDPLADDFTSGLRDSLDDFDQWASGVDQTQGYQEFIAYVRDNGPQVAETLGSLGGALLDIAVAAAPLGGPALAALEAIADVVSTIADSPLGTPLLALAGILATLNRGLAVVGKVREFNVQGTAAGRAWTAAGGAVDRTSKSYLGLRGAIAAVSAEQMTAQKRAQTSAADHALIARNAEEGRRVLGRYVGAAGKAAAGVAALTAVSTGAGEAVGLQNTAMLGLSGAMLGPWGAAIGVGVGAVLDLKAAHESAEDGVTALKFALEGTDYSRLTAEIAAQDEALSGLTDKALKYSTYGNVLSSMGGAVAGIGGLANLMGDGYSDSTSELSEQAAAARDAEAAYRGLADALTPRAVSMDTPFGPQVLGDARAFQKTMDDLGPTLERMGYGLSDLPGLVDQLGFEGLADEVTDFVSAADSTQGRTKVFASSIRDLGNEAMFTADSAAAMSSALESLLSPTLNAEEATDAWRTSLRALSEEIDGAAGFDGMTDAAVANRAVTRDYVRDFQAMISARAEAGAGAGKIASLVEEARQSFIREGVAAGRSAKEMRRRADALGLTPKLVQTTFRAAGIGVVERQARDLRSTYRALPKDVRTMVRTGNLPTTERDINRLIRKYPQLEKRRTALIRLRDLASKNLDGLLRGLGVADKKRANPKADLNTGAFDAKRRGLERQLGMVDKKKTNPRVDADTAPAKNAVTDIFQRLSQLNGTKTSPNVGADVGAALGGISSVQGALNGLRDRTVTVTTVQRTVRKNALGGYWPAETMAFADGGIRAPGDVADRHMPQIVGPGPIRIWGEPEAGGEGFVPLANDYRRAGAKAVTEQIVDRFGGHVEWYARGGVRMPESPHRGAVPFRPRPAGGGGGVLRLIEGHVTGALDVDTGGLDGQIRGVVVEELDADRGFYGDRAKAYRP